MLIAVVSVWTPDEGAGMEWGPERIDAEPVWLILTATGHFMSGDKLVALFSARF